MNAPSAGRPLAPATAGCLWQASHRAAHCPGSCTCRKSGVSCTAIGPRVTCWCPKSRRPAAPITGFAHATLAPLPASAHGCCFQRRTGALRAAYTPQHRRPSTCSLRARPSRSGWAPLAVAAPSVRSWPTLGGHERQLPGREARGDEAGQSGSFREDRTTAEAQAEVQHWQLRGAAPVSQPALMWPTQKGLPYTNSVAIGVARSA